MLAVDLDAMEDDRKLPCDSVLSFLHSDTLGEFHSPGSKGGPLFRTLEQDSCGFIQIGSQQSIAPVGDSAVLIDLAGPVASRREPEIIVR